MTSTKPAGSAQLREFRIARRDGATLADAAALAGMSMTEAKLHAADDDRDPPGEHCYVRLGVPAIVEAQEEPASHVVIVGDCRETMRRMPDASVDAIVCDPPYELGFMGKKWDSSGIAYCPEVWAEALRVLKPGGHLLAFSGSRTYHRMVVAIEDAGFEIRDQLMWIYGSGFPKSLNVSRAIDEFGGDRSPGFYRALQFTEWMRSTGMTATRINVLTGSLMGGHYLTGATQPAIPTPHLWVLIRPEIEVEIPEWIDLLVARGMDADFASGELPEIPERILKENRFLSSLRKNESGEAFVPKKVESQDWAGWGTALKPAHEPIVMARKPLCGTVAANVLAHGVGGINVDGCRVEATGRPNVIKTADKGAEAATVFAGRGSGWQDGTTDVGRFPANVLHDGSEEVVALFPETKSGARLPSERKQDDGWGMSGGTSEADSGSAARFFYSAKASRADRSAGGAVENVHPTVKPTDVMRWLVRLVTPKGGLVLDPFTGSGSTGRAAALEGMRFVGCELSEEYAAIARVRIAEAVQEASTARPGSARKSAKAKAPDPAQGSLF